MSDIFFFGGHKNQIYLVWDRKWLQRTAKILMDFWIRGNCEEKKSFHAMPNKTDYANTELIIFYLNETFFLHIFLLFFFHIRQWPNVCIIPSIFYHTRNASVVSEQLLALSTKLSRICLQLPVNIVFFCKFIRISYSHIQIMSNGGPYINAMHVFDVA